MNGIPAFIVTIGERFTPICWQDFTYLGDALVFANAAHTQGLPVRFHAVEKDRINVAVLRRYFDWLFADTSHNED